MKPIGLHDNFLRRRHPQASADLIMPVKLFSVTPTESQRENVRRNIEIDVPWLGESPAHDGIAVICGSAPSLRHDYAAVRQMKAAGATIFSCNAATGLLLKHGIDSEFQVLLDDFSVDTEMAQARCHLLASIIDPRAFAKSANALLWHPLTDCVVEVVDNLDRNFAYIGGGITVTICALAIAHTMGYRRLEVFGMDSSFDGELHHAENDVSPVNALQVQVLHEGVTYYTSYDLKQQVGVFLSMGNQLRNAGTSVNVHGTGLLPDAWRRR